MLLDAASLYFRAFYGVPTSVTTPDGRPINAVRGFLDMTARLLTTHGPDRLVACWDDDWRPAFRVEALPSYKAHRVAPEGGEEVPDELSPQVPVLVEVLAAVGHRPRRRARATRRTTSSARSPPAPAARSTWSPATATCSSWSTTRAASGCSTPPAGITDIEFVDEAAVAAKYGIPGRAYADFAVLRGDPSDGLPGVAGVGAKTAAALINEFGDLAGIRAAVGAHRRPQAAAHRRRPEEDARRGRLPRRGAGGGRGGEDDRPARRSRATLPRSPADPDALAELAEPARDRELGQAAGRGAGLGPSTDDQGSVQV